VSSLLFIRYKDYLIVWGVFYSAESNVTVSLVATFSWQKIWDHSCRFIHHDFLSTSTLMVSAFSSNSAAGVVHPVFCRKLRMLSLKAVYVKSMLSTCKRSWHTSIVFATLLRIVMWQFWHFIVSCCNLESSSFQVAQNTAATLFDFHVHTLCSYHMFLNLMWCQNYIIDIFDFCDLCKLVCVYVFVVIKDASFTVI